MKSIFLVFVALTLAVDVTNAIECYTCTYATTGIDFIDKTDVFDKSCQNGNTPDKKFSKQCIGVLDSCSTVVVEDGENKGIIRTCSQIKESEALGLETGKCVKATSQQIQSLYRIQVPSSYDITICSCTEDKCNSSSTLKISVGSLMILVIGLLTSNLMY